MILNLSLKKLEKLQICLDLDRELTFLNKYFNIDLLESIDDIKNNKILLFENMKNKILNYKLFDTMNIFHLTLRFKGSYDISFDLDFEIIRQLIISKYIS